MTTAPLLALPSSAELAALRLVAIDMDGTLLDADHRIDPRFWDLVDALADRGVEVAAASGRQLQALELVLGPRLAELAIVADNGARVIRHAQQLHLSILEPAVVREVTRRVRVLADGGRRAAVVLSGLTGAWIEARTPQTAAGAHEYYPYAEVVDDLSAVQDDALKISIYDADDVAPTLPALGALVTTHAVQQSHTQWADVMTLGTDKGAGLAVLQRAIGIGPEQTAAFGDHLNDLAMLRGAGISYAMANAHPDAVAAARFMAPANTESGVLRVLDAVLDVIG